jgi:hypothetical protein
MGLIVGWVIADGFQALKTCLPESKRVQFEVLVLCKVPGKQLATETTLLRDVTTTKYLSCMIPSSPNPAYS